MGRPEVPARTPAQTFTEERSWLLFQSFRTISAVNAQANLTTTNLGLQKALERLSQRLPHQPVGR
jgi:hypothetical protein